MRTESLSTCSCTRFVRVVKKFVSPSRAANLAVSPCSSLGPPPSIVIRRLDLRRASAEGLRLDLRRPSAEGLRLDLRRATSAGLKLDFRLNTSGDWLIEAILPLSTASAVIDGRYLPDPEPVVTGEVKLSPVADGETRPLALEASLSVATLFRKCRRMPGLLGGDAGADGGLLLPLM
jgi:hypothetical protein